MRIILVGSGSFIARHVIAACRILGIDHLPVRHDQDVSHIVKAGDCVINFAFDAHYRTSAYDEARDWDLQIARIAKRKSAQFVMLSTRRVYDPQNRWGAVEERGDGGDETIYGRNKAITEKAVRAVCGSEFAIFRLSNIFGYEYSSAAPRRSFLGQMLYTLKKQSKIFFDMHPDTRRDFLPADICASLLIARAIDGTTGTFNLGSGFAIKCGALAEWILEGHGSGSLIANPPIVRDEFYLDMKKWCDKFDLPIDETIVKKYCIELGRRLKCEKS